MKFQIHEPRALCWRVGGGCWSTLWFEKWGYDFVFMTRLVMAIDIQELGLSKSYRCCYCDLPNIPVFALVWQSQTCFTKLSPVTYTDISILTSELEQLWLLQATGACNSTLLCLKILILFFWRVLITSLLCLSSGLLLHISLSSKFSPQHVIVLHKDQKTNFTPQKSMYSFSSFSTGWSNSLCFKSTRGVSIAYVSVQIQTRCSFVIEFIILMFIKGSTCFEQHTAYHQEL
jgi:hypothetical protein